MRDLKEQSQNGRIRASCFGELVSTDPPCPLQLSRRWGDIKNHLFVRDVKTPELCFRVITPGVV